MIVLLSLLITLGIFICSFLVVAGLIFLLCLIFGFMFSWKIALGVFIIIILLNIAFKK